MNKSRFVYLYDDAQEALQILARGKNAVVWVTLGILLPTHSEGVSKAEIVTLTGLANETVSAALTSLTVSKLIEQRGENFVPSQYIEYRKSREKNFSDATELASSSFNSTSTNFYALYSEVFKELASLRGVQSDIQVENVERYSAEWVREAFLRTCERETQDVEAGNSVWWQTRRVSYALRILSDWERKGEMDTKRRQESGKNAVNPQSVEVRL